MVGGDRLAVQVCGEQEVFRQYHLQRQVGGEPVFRVLHHVRGGGLDFDESTIRQRPHGHAFPDRIEFAPARHAVDVHLDFGAWQSVELIPRPALLLLHLAPDAEVPSGGVKGWDRPVVQDGKFERQRLAGRKASFTADALFFLAPILIHGEHNQPRFPIKKGPHPGYGDVNCYTIKVITMWMLHHVVTNLFVPND